MKTIATALGAALMTALSVSGAEEYPATFQAIDTDRDGYISAKEAMARPDLQENWDATDQNGDGRLNSAEFSAFEGKGTLEPPQSEIPEPGAAPY